MESSASCTDSSQERKTNAIRKERGNVLKITASMTEKQAEEKPATIAAILERCREFYGEPENEKAFQEWMKEKKKSR